MNVPQIIIHKKAGHSIPKALFETALRKCPSASGFAVKYEENGEKSIQSDKFDKAVTAENLVEIADQAKDFEAAFYLGNFVTKLTNPKEDAQPYTVTVFDADEPENLEKSRDIVAFFVEGDFNKYAENNGHTEEYNFAHTVIIPMLGEIYEEVAGDIGKFTARLHKPSFEKNLFAHAGHRGVFLFFPLEGGSIAFGDSKGLAGEYDWGTASQHLDWDKPKEKAPITKATEATVAAVAAVKKNVFGIKTQPPAPSITTDKNGVHTVGNTTVIDAKGDMKADVEDKKNTASHANKGKIQVSPPPKLDGTARNKWIRLFNNDKLPDKHYDKTLTLWIDPELAPFAQRADLETVQDVKDLQQEINTGNKPKATGPVDMRKPANELPVSAVIPKREPEKRPPSDFVPDMNDAEMVEITGILADFVDRDKVPSAQEIQGMEKPWPKFSEKVGIPFHDMLRWRTEELTKIFKDKYAVMAFIEMRAELIKRMDVKELIGTAKVIVPDVPLNKKDDKKPVEFVSAPAKKNIFGLKKTG